MCSTDSNYRLDGVASNLPRESADSRHADMVATAIEVLPFSPEQPVRAIQLGDDGGTYFREQFVDAFPNAHVLVVGDENLSRKNTSTRQDSPRVKYCDGAYRDLELALSNRDLIDVAFATFSLDQFSRRQKMEVLKRLLVHIKPGGWFLNLTRVASRSERIQEHIHRARTRNSDSTSADAHQAGTCSLDQDLSMAGRLGLEVETLWKQLDEVVWGGYKPENSFLVRQIPISEQQKLWTQTR